LLNEKETKESLRILREDFADSDSVGAVRVARFLTDSIDEAIQADVAGFTRALLDLINKED
jgi:hypothetical protein